MAQPKTLSQAVRDVIRGMRIHQWLKNLLIAVPAATSHRIFEPEVFRSVFLAFFSFSICASAGYIVNDLLDLESDRKHPAKCRRPFASGALSPRFGGLLAFLLLVTAIGFGSLISLRFVIFLAGYLVLSAGYSAALKTMLLVDIFLLAFFYTFRVLLGGEAAGVKVSFWLAAFSTFFFFSLAVVKRFNELRMLMKLEGVAATRRDYRAEDLGMLAMWGAAGGCASVVVLALYINSEEVTRLYRQPSFLWPVCLAVLFWLNRIWMLANRDGLPYDPIVFAVRDRVSYLIAVFVAVSVFLAL